MRAFKVKVFSRWARKEGISDSVLRSTAREIAQGIVEADLGGYLFKKRIAKEGKGKSTSYRVIVALKKFNSDKLFFLFGFDKNDLSNITEKDKKAHGINAEVLLHLTDAQIVRLLSDGVLFEIAED